MTNRQQWNDDDLSQQLRALRREPLDERFNEQLHQRLVAAGVPTPLGLFLRLRAWARQHPLVAGTLSGVTAAAVTFILLFIGWNELDREGSGQRGQRAPQLAGRTVNSSGRDAGETPSRLARLHERLDASIEEVKVPRDKVALIRLQFTAEVSIEEVDFVVELPAGLSFWNNGQMLAERSFHWQGRLKQGENVIPIAVRATQTGRFHVRAVAKTNGEQLEHEVVFTVAERS